METRVRGPGRRGGLRGRADECAVLDAFVGDIRRGASRSLVLRGEAGIGKTALLEYLVESAPDLEVARAAGVESEMELAYASLHQLCASLLDRLETLPAPQRQAVEIVFGLSAGAAPDRFLVGLGVLSLLSEVAEERPLLCVVDDAQWLDHASALTLAFVARRLLAERVGIVFAARQPGEVLRHVPELEVRGVRNGDARALLSTSLRVKLDEQVRDRIIAESRGNPLALLELPRGLTTAELAGGLGLVGTQALPGRIEESFLRRVDTLSDDARRLLLLAAAEPIGDPRLLLRASDRLGIAVSEIEAHTDGLLAIGERVIFRHPLVRSAVYRSAGVQERRAVHLALAEATDRQVDLDRRAWHLAAAAAGPDEEVAAELERSADRAHARGGFAAAAAFLQRAVVLSTDPGARAERALGAAQASYQAGAFDEALRLMAAAEEGPLDDSRRARASLLRGQVAFASGNAVAAAPILLNAARRLEAFDIELSRQTYLIAWTAAFVAAQLPGSGVIFEVGQSVSALSPRSGRRALDLLLEGLALLQIEGPAAAAATLQQAARDLIRISAEDVLQWGRAVSGASSAVWDHGLFLETCARHVQIVRDAGALSQLPVHLNQLAMACIWSGDLLGAASLLAEIDSVTEATGGRIAPFALLMLRAFTGDESALTEPAVGGIDDAAGPERIATHARWSAAILFNGHARYDEAAASAQLAAANTSNPWFSMWALPELVEAGARCGASQSAREALERLAESTQASGTDWGLGIEARSRALLSEGENAERLHQEAIERLGRTQVRPELARAHLLYGEWLRREHRRVDAREQLRTAHATLSDMGMVAFAERARRELAATGETVRKRTVETRDDLTRQERQIARLAEDGLSNPEIGARLFLSPRTVEWHLRNVYTKLGIHSRRGLSSALLGSEPPA